MPHSSLVFRCFFSGRAISVFSERSFKQRCTETSKPCRSRNLELFLSPLTYLVFPMASVRAQREQVSEQEVPRIGVSIRGLPRLQVGRGGSAKIKSRSLTIEWTLRSSLSAVSTPIFATKDSLESSVSALDEINQIYMMSSFCTPTIAKIQQIASKIIWRFKMQNKHKNVFAAIFIVFRLASNCAKDFIM